MKILNFMFFWLLTISIAAQTTIKISTADEFVNQRLQRFSTQATAEARTLLFYENKPFSGTIVKEQGPGQLLEIAPIHGGISNDYGEEDDQYYSISFRNGRFSGPYHYKDNEYEAHFEFDEKGDPIGRGIIIMNPDFTPSHIPVRAQYINCGTWVTNDDSLFLDIDISQLNTTYDFQDEWDSRVQLLSDGYSDLADIIRQAGCSLPQEEYRCIDSITFAFQAGRTKEVVMHNHCGLRQEFDRVDFLYRLPLLDFHLAMKNGLGSGPWALDYNQFLFTPTYSTDFYDWPRRYIEHFTQFGNEEIFFGTLDHLPSRFDYAVDSNAVLTFFYDVAKMRKTAKRAPVSFPARLAYLNSPAFSVKPALSGLRLTAPQNYFEYRRAGAEYSIEIKSPELELSNSGNFDRREMHKLAVTRIDTVDNRKIAFTISSESAGRVLIKAEGTPLAHYTREGDRTILTAEIQAKLVRRNGSTLSLINEGPAVYRYSDGTEKRYLFRNGKVVFD